MTTTDRITAATSPPTIRSTGIPVAAILDMVASGMTAAEIVARESALEVEDVGAAVAFLGAAVARPDAASGGARRALGVTRRQLVRYLDVILIPRPRLRRGPPPEGTV